MKHVLSKPGTAKRYATYDQVQLNSQVVGQYMEPWCVFHRRKQYLKLLFYKEERKERISQYGRGGKKKNTKIWNLVKSIKIYITLNYVYRKTYVVLNMRESYMCVYEFEVKIVKCVWRGNLQIIAFSTILRHKMGNNTLTSGKLVICGLHTHTHMEMLLYSDRPRPTLGESKEAELLCWLII